MIKAFSLFKPLRRLEVREIDLGLFSKSVNRQREVYKVYSKLIEHFEIIKIQIVFGSFCVVNHSIFVINFGGRLA